MAIDLIIVDDHSIFRKGLKLIFEQTRDINVIGEANNGEELLNMLEFKSPDIVLLDINMPKLNGLDTLTELTKRGKKKSKPLHTIILSTYDSEAYIVKAIEEGASAYMSKLCEPDELVTAIEYVYENGIYFDGKANKAMQLYLTSKRRNKANIMEELYLNSTEQKVLKLLCNELTSTEIASKINVSKRTVEDIRYQLLKKTSTVNSVGLALWAAKNGLVELL
ncbi:MAG: response regulator transcription factor [Bacteroidetes bacterium]|nr:response regulator transcription factor [Bacteroidota bacterium]